MSKRDAPAGRLVFGKPSLSRVMCEKCAEETLHRFGRCIHCKTQRREVMWAVEPYMKRRRAV